MKHILAVILIISLYSALAEPPFELGSPHIQGTGSIEIDELVYSQTYNYAELMDGISNGDNHWVCEDFELDGDYFITNIFIWMIWTGEIGSMMNLVISEDDLLDSDPNTNIDIWAESVPCINTFTGDSNWGYRIYETHCVIDIGVYPELDSGVHYYIETQGDVIDNCFILASIDLIDDGCWHNSGNGVWVEIIYMSGYPHQFFDFYGEPISSLQSETWGSIKTLF